MDYFSYSCFKEMLKFFSFVKSYELMQKKKLLKRATKYIILSFINFNIFMALGFLVVDMKDSFLPFSVFFLIVAFFSCITSTLIFLWRKKLRVNSDVDMEEKQRYEMYKHYFLIIQKDSNENLKEQLIENDKNALEDIDVNIILLSLFIIEMKKYKIYEDDFLSLENALKADIVNLGKLKSFIKSYKQLDLSLLNDFVPVESLPQYLDYSGLITHYDNPTNYMINKLKSLGVEKDDLINNNLLNADAFLVKSFVSNTNEKVIIPKSGMQEMTSVSKPVSILGEEIDRVEEKLLLLLTKYYKDLDNDQKLQLEDIKKNMLKEIRQLSEKVVNYNQKDKFKALLVEDLKNIDNTLNVLIEAVENKVYRQANVNSKYIAKTLVSGSE